MTRETGAAGLARGPQVRSQRAAVRRAIVAGDLDVAELIAGDGDETIEAIALDMTLEQLLRSVPGVDLDVAADICVRVGVSLEARLHTLTIARRRAIAGALHPPGKEIA